MTWLGPEFPATIGQFHAEALVALRGHCVLRRGKGLPPLSPHPFLRKRPSSSASLRTGFS
jgi:hypothetical protein